MKQNIALFFIVAILSIPVSAFSEPEQLLRYYPHDDFRRYPVKEIYAGTPSPVVIDTDPRTKQFRTRLTEGAKHGPNFAGIYTVIEWGCGTNCQQVVIVNALTGRVSDWLTTEFGSKYQIDSLLFIENPDTEECSALEWCKTKHYLFKNDKFVLLR